MNQSTAAIKRHRTAKLAKLATKAYYLHRRKQDEQMYNLMCEEFVALGGVYVKFLQGVLLRAEIMRKWHNPDRLNIFEDLAHEQIDITRVMQQSYSREQLAQIRAVQPQPFAAGSFGQVYYGELANGTPVVIKVLRPMIRELLVFDLKLLSHFSRSFFVKLYPNMSVNIDQAIKEFRDATLRETDYVHEATFAHEMHTAYQGHSHFVVPETFIELCTPNIIVQEYIGGISGAQLMKLKDQGVDPKTYVKETLGSDLDTQLIVLGFESLTGIFKLPRIQGDPHPGNVKLLPGDQVGLIDFGISARTPVNKAAFLGLITQYKSMYDGEQSVGKIFEQFIRFFVNDLYRALKKLSQALGGDDKDKDFTKHIGEMAEHTFSKSIGGDVDLAPLVKDGSILKIINKVVNRDNRFGLVVRIEASEILRAAQTYMTLVETLGRRDEVLPRVFELTVEQVAKDFPELLHDQDDHMSMQQAVETVTNWLERVADRDPALFQELAKRIRVSNTKKEATEVAEKDG